MLALSSLLFHVQSIMDSLVKRLVVEKPGQWFGKGKASLLHSMEEMARVHVKNMYALTVHP